MSSGLVSVIIPVYNAEKTLPRALASVQAQTWKAIQVILIDDGSEDRSGEMIDQAAQNHSNVLAAHLGTDAGVSAARNRGLELAKGDFVTFLDADDAMAPTMIEELLALHEQTGADICGCGFQSISPEDARKFPMDEKTPLAQKENGLTCQTEQAWQAERKGGRRTAQKETQQSDQKQVCQTEQKRMWQAEQKSDRTCRICQTWKGEKIIEQAILTNHDTRVWSKLFIKGALEGKRFRTGLTIGEDMLFFLSLIETDISYSLMEEKLYLYTVNPQGAMEKPFVPSYMDQLRCWELARKTIVDRFPQLLEQPENNARLAALQLVSAVLTASKIARLSPERRKEYAAFFQECRRQTAALSRVAGVEQFLPKDYIVKKDLLLHLPLVYQQLYRNR